MQRALKDLYQILQDLLGYHRQLLEVVKAEKLALISSDLKEIQENLYSKEVLIASIKQLENKRLLYMRTLTELMKKDDPTLSLKELIIEVQAKDLPLADQFRSVQNALTVMLKRISEQNRENAILVENSLKHISNMKRNILGEAVQASDTYSAKGVKNHNASKSRLISGEV